MGAILGVFWTQAELATAFTEFLASKRGREVFKKHGYTVQDPTGPADRP